MIEIQGEPFEIRRAVKSDARSFLKMIVDFASFERLEPPDTAARARLVEDIFDRKLANLLVASSRRRLIGYALYYFTYSSFLARPTLFLEDLFVDEDSRKLGVGNALFEGCREEAARKGCGRMEWAVLTWNKNAIDFYERKGAERLDWFLYRLKIGPKSGPRCAIGR